MPDLAPLVPTVSGTGHRWLVLGNGFGTTQAVWRHVRPWLEARWRVLSYDLAGATQASTAVFSFDRHARLEGWADDLLALLDAQRVDRVAYVGHSVSGMIGMLAALQRPGLFERMVLIAPSPRYLDDPATGYVGGFRPADLEALFAAMASNYQGWALGFAPLMTDVPAGHPAAEEFARGLFGMRPDIALHMVRVIFGIDLRPLAGQHRVPTVIVRTHRDQAVPDDVARWLHAHWPGSVLETLEANGHVPQATHPQRLLEVFARHLEPA